VKVQAVGTSFSVRNFSAAPVEVLVQEGVVEVGRTMSEKPVRVGANTKVLAPIARDATLNVVSVDPEAVSHELSWRQGVLAFEDITLAMAALEFSRYSDTRIVFSDPQIGLVTISGLFSADNPEAFAQAAAVSLGLKLTFRDGEIRLERR
jgi:transmembrane sensor